MKYGQDGRSNVVICFIKYAIYSYTGKDTSILFLQGRYIQKPMFKSILSFDSKERVTRI